MRGYARYVLEKHQKERTMRPPKLPAQTAKAFPSVATSPAPAEPKSVVAVSSAGSQSTNESQPRFPPPVQKAAAGFAKAKVDESAFKEVDEFLTSVSLAKYKDLFLDNGFEDLESVLELRDEHFQTMGIPLGHKLKMLKRIRELKGVSASTSVAVPAPMKASDPKSTSNSAPKVSTRTDVDAQFDEDESHKQFLEAREAWLKERQQLNKPVPVAIPTATGKGEKADAMVGDDEQKVPAEEKRPGIFGMLLAAGGDAWNVNCLPEYSESGTDMSPKNSAAAGGEIVSLKKGRESCYGCYKLFEKEAGFRDTMIGKLFCGEQCFQKYCKENMTTCGGKECGKQFLKEAGGVARAGRWFCGEKCAADEGKANVKEKANEEKKEEKTMEPGEEKEIERETDEMLRIEP